MIKVALTGSTGLVGSRIIELLKNEFEFIFLTHSNLDITDKKNTANTISNIDFDIFLHLAAYTNVDGAEKEPGMAYKINAEGTRNLLEPALKMNKKFIYFSTDFVFDGSKPPYFEDSFPNPLGVYAKSKYEGEKIVSDKGMIIRTAYPYRSFYEKGGDFARNIARPLREGKELSMISDSLITPTYIDDIAFAMKNLLNNFSNEIFHIVGSESLSPFDSALKIADRFNLNKSLIKKTSLEEYSIGKAPRPKYSVIKSKKNSFYKMKSFSEGLNLISEN